MDGCLFLNDNDSAMSKPFKSTITSDPESSCHV